MGPDTPFLLQTPTWYCGGYHWTSGDPTPTPTGANLCFAADPNLVLPRVPLDFRVSHDYLWMDPPIVMSPQAMAGILQQCVWLFFGLQRGAGSSCSPEGTLLCVACKAGQRSRVSAPAFACKAHWRSSTPHLMRLRSG